MTVELPAGSDVTVIRKREMPIEAEPRAAVARALATPVDAPPLRELAAGKSSACILVCDVTRPVPNGLFLQPMIRELEAAGIPLAAITVLIATGLHRPNEGAELESVIGDPWVMQNVRVENHFARNDADHVDLGQTPTRQTPVKLDRRFVDAELRIATGLVEPHFMAGYSGGRKVVAPGIAHHETIRTFHNARFMEDPLAVQCVLEGNPLHEEQLEILKMLGPVYALNTVIDEARRLSFVNFGEIVASHMLTVEFVHGYCTVEVPRRFHTVLTTAAGYPLDRTYYQTVKGMVTPMDILDTESKLIVASDCSEGLGSDAFRASQQRLGEEGSERFMERIAGKRFADVDEWQSEMQLKALRSAEIQLFSPGLPAADRGLTGVDMIDSIEAAISRSIEQSGDPAIAVIPEGPYVVPIYAG